MFAQRFSSRLTCPCCCNSCDCATGTLAERPTQPIYANWQRPGSKEMYIPSSWLRKDPHIPDISVIHFVVDSFEPLENGGTIHPPVDIDCTFLISSGLSWRAYNNLRGHACRWWFNKHVGWNLHSLTTLRVWCSGTSRGSQTSNAPTSRAAIGRQTLVDHEHAQVWLSYHAGNYNKTLSWKER